MDIDSSAVRSKLKEFFGFDSFKGDQEKIVMQLLQGNDAFVIMPTGGGKSLCYQLPALLMDGTAIVVSPLIALMKNQVDAIRGFVSGNGGIAHFLNSSLSRVQLAEVTEDLISGVTKLLYVAPESLTKEENVAILKKIHVSFYAVDEAHCISDWGHDFRPEYRRIRPIIDEIGRAPIIALTATATPKVQSDILKNLGIGEASVFKSSFNRPNLYYEVRDKEDPDKDIIRYIKQNPGKSGIIYCLSRKKVEELCRMLVINDIKAVPYHAGMDAKVRAENQDKFLMEDVDVIVATIAFGMGIDKPDVRFVIHYDIPRSLEGYYQETGRAGRDGKEGVCIAYYSHKDVRKLDKFLQGKPVAEQEIGRQLLLETVSYAESGECRRKLLLGYFGEDYNADNCCSCDNCLNPRPKFDAQKEMCHVIELVSSLPEGFRIDHLANVLAGIATAMVKSYNHDHLKLFGIGRGKPVRYWERIIHQGLIWHFLKRNIDTYGLISVSDEGLAYLADPHPLMLAGDRTFSEGNDDDDDEVAVPSDKSGGGDPVLLSMLKALRHDEAKRRNLQPWVIFSDAALDDMSIMYPEKTDELMKCQGVGQGKAEKFGAPFLSLISKYVEENEISRPEDFVVKSMPNETSDKLFIIHSVDRRMDLEDIAEARGMEMTELLGTMENIVEAGTKLNLDYYIEQNMDPEVVEEIYDYFRNEASSDSIDSAMNDLCPDYEETEIRLVRLKFLSEVAN